MTKTQLIDELESMYRRAEVKYDQTGDPESLGEMTALDRAITLAEQLDRPGPD